MSQKDPEAHREYCRQYYLKNRERFLANRARYRKENPERVAESKKRSYEKHKDKWTTYYKKWRAENLERIKKKRKQYYEEHKEEIRIMGKKRYDRKRDSILKQKKEYVVRNQVEINRKQRIAIQKRRKIVLDHYGGKCQWPEGCEITDPDMLQIDHINGDGAEHRKKVAAAQLCSWLIRNNFPPGFRILCANHNWKHKANLKRKRYEENGIKK